jgi:hypothetical protein
MNPPRQSCIRSLYLEYTESHFACTQYKQIQKKIFGKKIVFNPILHTAWLESHALTLKNNTVKHYFGEKSSFLHTFQKFSAESRTIQVNF